MRLRLAPVLLALGACASSRAPSAELDAAATPPDARELVAYAALACDAARASEVAFVFHESEAFHGP